MTPTVQPKGISWQPVDIVAGRLTLPGELCIPEQASGLVLFVHGSGSSRHSPRNRAVAEELHRGRFATLLFDLLTPQEEEVDLETAQYRFDIRLLARRVIATTVWVRGMPPLRGLPVGYFGASTGAAAALVAASQLQELVGAVVSRGGRPDLAGDALASVRAPTLLIVGGSDVSVLDLNEQAYNRLTCEKKLRVIPGATHLFEEPGALERVARLARAWFRRHLTAESSGGSDDHPIP